MSLVVPESFHYGDQDFPWDGRIEPKLFRRRKWLLASPVIYGPVPLISACVEGTTPVEIVSTSTPIVISDDSFASVQVFTRGISVFSDICCQDTTVPVTVSKTSVAVTISELLKTVAVSVASVATTIIEACAPEETVVETNPVGVASISSKRSRVSIG